LEELFDNLNDTLAKQALSKDIHSVRSTLQLIIDEALKNAGKAASKAIPETIKVLFEGYHKQPELFKEEVLQGKFSETVFSDFCSCMTDKGAPEFF